MHIMWSHFTLSTFSQVGGQPDVITFLPDAPEPTNGHLIRDLSAR